MPAIVAPLPQFFDLAGAPLESGSVYIGAAGGNPETAPVSVYWDSDLTQPAAQPLRTTRGFVARGGTPAPVYVSGLHSLTVKQRNGVRVLYSPTSLDADNATALRDDLVSTASSKGSALIGYLPAGTGAVGRTAQAKLREVEASVADFLPAGYVTDGSVNYTTQIQAAIDSAQSAALVTYGKFGRSIARLKLPSGNFSVSGLTITRPLSFVGNGRETTMLNLVAGSTVPLINVQVAHDSFDYFAFGMPAWVLLSDMTLTADSAADVPGQGVAHGVYATDATTNPVSTWLVMERMSIVGMPATGVYGSSMTKGAAFLRDVQSYYCGQDILRVFSCADWRVISCDFGGGSGTNASAIVNISGSTGLEFTDSYFYTAKENVLTAFNAVADFKGCYFDLAGKSAVAANINRTGSYDAVLTFSQCFFRWAGQTTDNAYPTFDITTGTGGLIKLLACDFRSIDNPFGSNKTNGDIIFAAAGVGVGTRVYIDGATKFDRGFPGGTSADGRSVTNRTDYLLGFASTSTVGNTGAQKSLGALASQRTTLSYAATVNINASLGNLFEVTANNGVAFAIAAPTNPTDGQRITVMTKNTSGGALGAITPNAVFKLTGSAWPTPATGTNIKLYLYYDGTNWTEEGRSGAVPN
jgi:hypothetical protein